MTEHAELIERLRGMFVRFATETEDEAALRRKATAREAATALDALVAENARLRRFVKHIAKQHLSEQCRAEHEDEGNDGEPDFEGAYDAIIEQARAALAQGGD